MHARTQRWALKVFFIVSIKKMIFLHFLSSYELCASPIANQINLIKIAKKSFFVSEKIKKYQKCPSLTEHAKVYKA